MSAPLAVRPAERGAAADRGDDGLSVSPGAIAGRVWHLFISMRFGIALILFLTVLAFVGTLLVQAPAGVRADPQAYAAWLDEIRPKYGGWTTVLDALGLFSIFTSVWFEGAMILLIVSTVACSAHRAPFLWHQARDPRVEQSDAFFDHAALSGTIDSTLGADEAADALVASLRARGFRTVTTRDERGIHVFGDRFRYAPFGTVVAHLSIVVVAAGVLIGSAFGFRDSAFTVPIGTPVEVGYGSGLSVLARSFTDSYSAENGAPSDYASDLVVYRGGEEVGSKTIRVNEPLTVGDVTFYQSFFGPATDIRIADATGAVLYAQGVPLLWDTRDGNERAGRFDLPQKGLTVVVVSAASGKVSSEVKAGQVQVELYPQGGSTPAGTAVLDQGKPATIDGLTVTFEREQQFTGLIVAKDPGVPLVWGGAILLVLGMCAVFFLRNRRTWGLVRAKADGGSVVRVAAIARHDAAFASDFPASVAALGRALDGHDRT